MALFFRDDRSYDESRRMTGFNRYRQLLNAYALRWMLVNIITLAGALPLLFAIWISIASSSIAVLFPASAAGGLLFGPFLAGLVDSIFRGLRDAPGKWWENYKKSWKQNALSSLFPGAFTGLFTGLFSFMIYMLWIANRKPSAGTIFLLFFSAVLFLILNTLFWPQLVLFRQKNSVRLVYCILFTAKHFLPVFGTGLLELGYIFLYLLFAPWTLILVPFIGLWFILFLSEFLLYDSFNEDFHVEETHRPFDGDPWAE